MKKKKLPSLKRLGVKCWRLMSLYSRQKDAGENGYTSCFTCGIPGPWREFDAGHLYHASKQSPVTYDHRNVHAQCRRCNFFNKDARVQGGLYVEKRYGSGTAEILRLLKHSGKPMRRPELEEKIDELEKLLCMSALISGAMK